MRRCRAILARAVFIRVALPRFGVAASSPAAAVRLAAAARKRLREKNIGFDTITSRETTRERNATPLR
jgi:hypothetical protein